MFTGIWPLWNTVLILVPADLALASGYLSKPGSRWFRFADGMTALFYLGVMSLVAAVYGKFAFPGAVKYWPLWLVLYVLLAAIAAAKKKVRVMKWLNWVY